MNVTSPNQLNLLSSHSENTMIANTINKINTPCIPPHLLLSIFSFLWENVKPYTKGTIFVLRSFIMAKGVIHMFDIDEILTIGEVIEHHDNLVASIDQLLKGIKSLRGSGDALAGIDKDQRLPVQLLYKEYEKLVSERESLLNQVIIRTK